MLIYILVILLILILRNNVVGIPSGIQRNMTEDRYLKIVCWVLVLLAALRGSSVGTDTIAYIWDYDSMPNLSFVDVLEKRADYPGYYLFAKTCSFLHFPVQLMFGLLESFYVYAMYKFISRHSEDKLFSILGFTVLDLYAFSLAGLKQTMSMGFVLLYYLALEDKKYVKTVLLALAAYYCHHASLIFLVGVALFYMRKMKLFYVYLTAMVVVTLVGTRFLWTGLLQLLENDHYSELYLEDEGYSSTTMIIYGVLMAVLFLFSKGYRQQRVEESKVMLGMSTVAFVFQAFAFVSSAAFRLSYYFLPFMMVAFPNNFNRIGNVDTRQWVKTGTIIVLIFVFVYTGRNGGSIVPYRFFWQGGL